MTIQRQVGQAQALGCTNLTISERGKGGRWVTGQRIEASGCMFL
ncbi:hypothetical protein [Pseudomonas sediminis]|nr:hypothetical protein [Pseudomonas sediminis]